MATVVPAIDVSPPAVAAIVVVLVLLLVLRHRATRSPDDRATAEASAEDAEEMVRARARDLHEEIGFADEWELRQTGEFADAVEALSAAGVPTPSLVPLALDEDEFVACIALAVLTERDDLPPEWPTLAARRLARSRMADEDFLLRSLIRVPGRVVGPVLAQVKYLTRPALVDFLRERVEAGERVDVQTFADDVPDAMFEELQELFDEEPGIPGEVRSAFEQWRVLQRSADLGRLLTAVGRVWSPPFDEPPAALVGDRAELVDRIAGTLAGPERGSVVLIGEHGVGKTTLLRAALDRAGGEPLVFAAPASAINAGATLVGELEGRVQELVDRTRDEDFVWVLPRLEEALWAGQHTGSPQGLLDALLPHIESGALAVAGEVSPSGWDLLVKQRPRIAGVMTVVRVAPLSADDSLSVAHDALETGGLGVRASPEVLAEGHELAQQFLPAIAPPGGLHVLIAEAAEAVAADGRAAIGTRDILAVLARRSGLPLTMLDAETPLAIEDVRAFFSERVMGQPEAVETLVERIAMVKAGLTDPTRPLGVFLFVGPTGTGKTEIAKTMAEFMFGSAGRLVRLDMSEFQTPDSLERLLADATTEPRAAPLIAAVRKDPFAVVLMDEFEKAAAPIWDLFLQVFDDGRLTDLGGRTVDFRRCVFILTSNLGSSIAGGGGMGFERREETFNPRTVERTLANWFRPEFLNRVDRVVVFRPFARDQMRAMLDKELRDIVERRGLRARPWAIEYDESALRFLIDKGFSPHLGARPLKRAVERYLLAPLAQAIVEHTAPSGDQFLFVSAGKDRIRVRFVDPDADDGAVRDDVPAADLDLKRLALSPRADPPSARRLLAELERIANQIRGPAVQDRKRAALEALGRPGFWEDEGRFGVLAEANYLDRMEEALRTAEKLGARLERLSRRNGSGTEVAGMLAIRLHVLECALAGLADGASDDVFLRIQPTASAPAGAAAEFARRLEGMYAQWAERRGMHVEPLTLDRAAQRAGAGHADVILLLGGLGAATILAREAGLHILEIPGPSTGAQHAAQRVSVAVSTAPCPPGDPGRDSVGAARRALAEQATVPTVVRRYRLEPTPLVRDAVRGFRTGRVDRVLAGDFDLF